MVAARSVFHGFGEYVRLADESNVRLEYLKGQIYAMAGGTVEHARLQGTVIMLLANLLDGPCRAHSSDQRVRVRAADLATYPDVTIVCGAVERDTEDATAVVNPTVLFEITSPSTETYDRTEKRMAYQKLGSLRHYVVVSHATRAIDVWTRGEGDVWSHVVAHEGDVASLPAIESKLDVRRLYDVAAVR